MTEGYLLSAHLIPRRNSHDKRKFWRHCDCATCFGSDYWSKKALNRGVYLQTTEDGQVTADLYVYLEYGVNVPAVSMDVQRAVKAAVFNYADVEVDVVNIHAVGIVPDKTPKPTLEDLFGEDFLDEE